MKKPIPYQRFTRFLVRFMLCSGMTLNLTTAQELPSVNLHPQLSSEQAASYSYEHVVNSGSSPWDPLADALVDELTPKPDYIVDQAVEGNGVNQFHNLQSCINRVIAESALLSAQEAGKKRLTVLIRPGTYHELLYIPPLRLALTLYGSGTDARQTRISMDLDATVTGADYLQRFESQFAASDSQTRAMFDTVKIRKEIGTDGTATAWIMSDSIQIKNLTIENAYQMQADCLRSGCHTGKDSATPVHHQAVALMLDGADQAQFEQVRLLGHQDTLYLKSSLRHPVTRTFFNKSYVEGDVDFIFGDTSAYFYQSEIKSLGDRPVSYVVAPATNYQTRYGFVFDHCHFTSERSTTSSQFFLARQWFHNQKCTPYAPVALAAYQCAAGETDKYIPPAGTISKTVLETVGKVIIMNSRIGAHINPQQPWSDWNKRGSLAYRPAQFSSDDFWGNLRAAGIDPVQFMGYSAKKTPTEWFMAEFNNSYE